MPNIIEKMMNVDIILAIGMLIAFIGSAAYVPSVVSGILSPYAPIGYLLIVVAAVFALYNKFWKK